MTKTAYYRVTIAVDYEAESPEQAKEYAKELIGHVMRTGCEADIVCPEDIQVLDDVKAMDLCDFDGIESAEIA